MCYCMFLQNTNAFLPGQWPSILIELCRCGLWKNLPLEILHKVLQELTHILSMISYCCWSRKGRRIMSMMKIETMITMCIILMIIPINNMTMMIIIQAKVCWRRLWQRWRWQSCAKTDGWTTNTNQRNQDYKILSSKIQMYLMRSSFDNLLAFSLQCRQLLKNWTCKFASGASIYNRYLSLCKVSFICYSL